MLLSMAERRNVVFFVCAWNHVSYITFRVDPRLAHCGVVDKLDIFASERDFIRIIIESSRAVLEYAFDSRST